MANFGARLAYPTPERPATPAVHAAGTTYRPTQATATHARGDAPLPPAPGAAARLGHALRRLARLWAEGLAGAAAPAAVQGWATPTAYLPGTRERDAAPGAR